MKNNKYINIITEEEKKYEGKIISLINEAKVKMSEAADIYQPRAIAKYQKQIVKDTVNQVNTIRDEFLKNVASKLDAEAAKIGKTKGPDKSNTEKLLEAIELQNRLQLESMALKFKDTSELITLGKETEDTITLKLVKNELLQRSEKMEDKTEGQALRITTKSLQGYGEATQLEEVKSYFQDLINNKDFLPGVPFGTQAAISNVEEYLTKEITEFEVGE